MSRHPVAHHERGIGAELGGAAGDPALRAASDRQGAARRPGMVAVGSIRTPVTSPSNSSVSSTVASPRIVRGAFVWRQPVRRWAITAPVSSRISGPGSRDAGAGPLAAATATHDGDLHVQPVGPQQPRQHRRPGRRAIPPPSTLRWAFGDGSSVIPASPRSARGIRLSFEQQHHNVSCGQSGSWGSAGIGLSPAGLTFQAR